MSNTTEQITFEHIGEVTEQPQRPKIIWVDPEYGYNEFKEEFKKMFTNYKNNCKHNKILIQQ